MGMRQKDIELVGRRVLGQPKQTAPRVEYRARLGQQVARRVTDFVGVIAGSAERNDSHGSSLAHALTGTS